MFKELEYIEFITKIFYFIYRSLARIGNAYCKKDEFSKALVYYNKSLSEHRDPDVVKKSQEVCWYSVFLSIAVMIRNLQPIQPGI